MLYSLVWPDLEIRIPPSRTLNLNLRFGSTRFGPGSARVRTGFSEKILLDVVLRSNIIVHVQVLVVSMD